jgi:hypothetical protein
MEAALCLISASKTCCRCSRADIATNDISEQDEGSSIRSLEFRDNGAGVRCQTHHRHCEERSDEAIQSFRAALDCFASLAMTRREHAKWPNQPQPQE